jgi:tryptophanyl-tRNA synthetase
LLSGVAPTGNLTLGNYLGAVKHWAELQDRYDCLFVLVDLHAITTRQQAATLRQRSYDFLALCMACGLDPERNTIFVQSHVPAHAQLAWVLNCTTQMGELSRMTQFKDKAGPRETSVTAGLFDYPVLMAADILLYGTNLVPVGEDQTQHLELTRTLARRFNGLYGEIFTVPEPYIPKVGARIMSLQAPTQKMSKSDPNPNGSIALLDEPDAIRRKIKRAVTDSGSAIAHDASRPAIANLMTIFSCVTGEPLEAIERDFAGKGYGQFKDALADAVIGLLDPIQQRYRALRADQRVMSEVLNHGAQLARERASHMITRVHAAVGFVPDT